MERLVEVLEQEVRIDFALNCKCRANVRLRSLCATTPIAFKVQTSSPNKFLVNPPSGLVPPLSYATFQIILKPQTQFPPTFPRSPSDRFLVKASEFTTNPSESTHPDSINSWFSSRPHGSTQDLKLKVAFVGPVLLRHAVGRGDVEAVRNLIKRQKFILTELSPRESESLLRVATQLVSPDEMVNLLVEAGLKIESRVRLNNNTSHVVESRWASKGLDELHVAVAFDQTDEMLSLIKLKEYRSLDCRDKEGRTPLDLAASKGNIGCAKLLLESGVNTNTKCKDGRTALHRAAANGNHRMVEMLMDFGADPTITNDRGQSAVDVARDKEHKEVVEILERGEQVLMAARRGELERLESLLQKGASMNYCDQYGLTALHAAAIKGHRDAVLMLVKFGIDLECKDNEGHVPLHLAVEGGNLETVEVLVDKGADVNARTIKGVTPLYLARAMCYDDISEFLISRGASSCITAFSSS
uniref:MSP domain-containing protein n=2 Tax=Quercus lobata TaxID=97700 RepID=A0A7N2R9X5_QUELO